MISPDDLLYLVAHATDPHMRPEKAREYAMRACRLLMDRYMAPIEAAHQAELEYVRSKTRGRAA